MKVNILDFVWKRFRAEFKRALPAQDKDKKGQRLWCLIAASATVLSLRVRKIQGKRRKKFFIKLMSRI